MIAAARRHRLPAGAGAGPRPEPSGAARRHWRALLDALPPSVTASHEFDETVTLFDGRGHRAEAVEVGDDLLESPSARALQVDEPPFRAGWTPFRRRRDKRGSPTGRISFAVMRPLGIGADGHVGPHGPVRRTDVPPAGHRPCDAALFLTLAPVL